LFSYDGPRIATATDVTFVDTRGAMVGAYRLAGPPGAYSSLVVTRRSTGDYLIVQLMRTSPELAEMGQAQREARARHFVKDISTPDSVHDYPDLMGAHYAHAIAKDGAAVQPFLERLAARLLVFDTAAVEEFRMPASAGGGFAAMALVERAAGAGDASCSSTVGNLLTVSGAAAFGVQGAFPVAGTVISAAVSLLQLSCDDTSSRLDAIDSKLDALQASLDGLADSLGELRIFTAQTAINVGEDAFQSLGRDVERLASSVRVLKLNYRVASLQEYVRTIGADSPAPLRRALEK
jgi:hypothetical protein